MTERVHLVSRRLLREVYDRVLAEWPDNIVAGAKTFHLGDGCNMRGLNETHFAVEDWLAATVFEPEVDAIVSNVEWCIFQGIHGALRNLTQLRKQDLDFEAFVSRFDGLPSFKVVE